VVDRRESEEVTINPKVFVGNLSFETTPSELQALFSEIAEVVNVVVPSDRLSGRPRGFAFVEFAEPQHVSAAIQKFDGFELGGRRLRVNEATERQPGAPSPGFSRPFSDAPPARRPRPKGSRRNLRARKRSIW
jgi:RNA recognition motif-containing protein